MTDKPASDFAYGKDNHAAYHTSDYVFAQLIPYIGNKRKLLPLIGAALRLRGVAAAGATFLDLFAGSGVVSRMAKRSGFRVISSDWEPYAEAINRCFIECNTAPAFAALGGYENATDFLNRLAPREGWITRHLCPADDTDFDISRERMFYTHANGLRLDAMREQIESWHNTGAIDEREKSCLLAPLLYAACYASNTSGVFKGFHNGWGGQTATALYRILAPVTLRPAVFFDNGLESRVMRGEASEIASLLQDERTPVDVVYLDPPYNQHPYGSNYHVLNTITLWDNPALTENIEGRNKAAIRLDWRTERRSAYNFRKNAATAYHHLMQTLTARFILTSYSTDGMIPLESLIETNLRRGHTQFVQQEYKRYRVSSQRFSDKPVNVEFVLVTDTSRPHTGATLQTICQSLRVSEQRALQNHPEEMTRKDGQLSLL